MRNLRRWSSLLVGALLAAHGQVTGQDWPAPADTVALTSAMLDGSLIRPGTAVFRAYELPCPFSPGRAPRQFGVLREEVRWLERGDSTLILQITRRPLLYGAMAVDSSLYDRRTLAPVRWRGHVGSLFVEMLFGTDSVAWRVEQPKRRTDSGGARIPPGAHFVGSDMFLVRALKHPEPLTDKLATLTFVDMEGPHSDVVFEAYLGVAWADSVPFPGVPIRSAWAIALGSGADKVFFVEPGTHELLGWEEAEQEGTCPLRYVRVHQTRK